ncbi:MAG: pyridoxamine 5'-phosphate oxidase family protein [Rhodospirillales bacterium]|nr:pyridoxamine 5'-phosphate oxidase family protein [Rhodospirillales bacterium]
MSTSAETFPLTRRNRVVRRPMRGHYDKATVYDILDRALVCHLAYVIDGQPYCTPTAFWRDGDTLYWHGSAASRMIRNQGQGNEGAGLPVCLTVTHMDAIVLARCGFNHSINYRSVMAFGTARRIDDDAEKVRLMDRFLDRFFPGRAGLVRQPTRKEVKATSFIAMPIEQASAKIRDVGVHDDEEDYAVPAWTALLPVRTVLGRIEECPRQMPGVRKPRGMKGYVAGRRLDEIFLEASRAYAPAAGEEGPA